MLSVFLKQCTDKYKIAHFWHPCPQHLFCVNWRPQKVWTERRDEAGLTQQLSEQTEPSKKVRICPVLNKACRIALQRFRWGLGNTSSIVQFWIKRVRTKREVPVSCLAGINPLTTNHAVAVKGDVGPCAQILLLHSLSPPLGLWLFQSSFTEILILHDTDLFCPTSSVCHKQKEKLDQTKSCSPLKKSIDSDYTFMNTNRKKVLGFFFCW